jgi:hypothetical protein
MPLCPGRDWKACAEHVGTRDSRAIASHAQKHFIKLCIRGELLPARVAQSGAGYTLSGKPLDPESAAAKAYGFKPGMLESEGCCLISSCACCMCSGAAKLEDILSRMQGCRTAVGQALQA